MTRTPGIPLMFEVSWEVCSQAGGIYSVLRSRAPAAVRCWGDGYWLIGPYHEASAQIEFEETPPSEFIKPVLEEMRKLGVVIHCGQWLVTGRPQVLLIDVKSVLPRLGEIRYFLWEDTQIRTPDNDFETNDLVAFGNAVADLLVLANRLNADRPMLAHFHEWQGAVAISFLKKRKPPFATVFTTHATVVGRSLCSANGDLYDHMHEINAEVVAREHSITHKFLLEREAAQNCDVFTTVSEITAQESAQFLGRRPEALVPNGLNVERFAAPHEFQVLHRQNKEKVHEFVMGHFFPSYTFDLDKTLYIFTAGRYEYRNKGLDVFIDSLYELNQRLKANPNGVNVIAFFIIKAPVQSLNVNTLNRQAMFDEMFHTCSAIGDEMKKHLVKVITDGRLPVLEDLLDEYAVLRLKRIMHAFRQKTMPTVVTHDLWDEVNDPILKHLRLRQLTNKPDDPVKVIFHPDFLSVASPLLGLEYDQFVRACNLGVFPSYYEPWGYTPLECVVRGVPAITSDLSGFGTYVKRYFTKYNESGLYVAPRRGVDDATTVQTIASWLYELTRLSRRERIQQRNLVESYGDHFDWRHLIRYYLDAWKMAFDKRYPGLHVVPTNGANPQN